MATMRESASHVMATKYSFEAFCGQSSNLWTGSLSPSACKLTTKHTATLERQSRRTVLAVCLTVCSIAAAYTLFRSDSNGAEGNRRLLMPHAAIPLADSTSARTSEGQQERIPESPDSNPDQSERIPEDAHSVSQQSGKTQEASDSVSNSSARNMVASNSQNNDVTVEKIGTASAVEGRIADERYDPSISALVAAHIVPDVLNPFTPFLQLEVVYNGVVVTNGIELTWRELTPFLTASSPIISIGGNYTELFTMIMADPDAPNPESPTAAQFCHWLWVNVPGGSVWGSGGMPAAGNELLKYIPPNPPTGVHRFIIVVIAQTQPTDGTPLDNRRQFDIRDFASKYELGRPAAAVYFLAKRDSNIVDEPGAL